MLKPMLCLLVAAMLSCLIAPAQACEPSSACALQRARQLAIDHLHQQPAAGSMRGGWADAARLIATVEQEVARPELDSLVAELLERAEETRYGDAVLHEVVMRLALTRPEKALAIAGRIRNTLALDDTYAALGRRHAAQHEFELATQAIQQMLAGDAQTHELEALAQAQLSTQHTDDARATAELLPATAREVALAIRAHASAIDAEYVGALQLIRRIRAPHVRDRVLDRMAELQLQRRDFPAARLTLRQQLALLPANSATDGARPAVLHLAERLAMAGALEDAMALLEHRPRSAPELLGNIALGQARHGDFAGAGQTLAKLAGVEHDPGARARRFMATHTLLWTTDTAAVLHEVGAELSLPELEAVALDLGERGKLPSARSVFAFATARATHSRSCRDAQQCDLLLVDSTPNTPCGEGYRETELCSLAALQAQLGWFEAADATAAKIGASDPLVRALTIIGTARAARAQSAEARHTFERSLRLAAKARTIGALNDAITAYAAWLMRNSAPRAALAKVFQAARTLAALQQQSGTCLADGALLQLAATYSSIGEFSAALVIAEQWVRCDRAGAYLTIYTNSRSSS